MRKLSAAQRRVINHDDVQWCGWDEKERPVVKARFHSAFILPIDDANGAVRVWAILRNGDPADVTGKIKNDI